MQITMDSLPHMLVDVWSHFKVLQTEAAYQFDMLLSIENPPIQQVIASGVVSRFVEFLGRHDVPRLQYASLSVLTKIASGTPEQAKVVIQHGAIPIFVKLINSPADYVSGQAIWGLGAVSLKSPQLCELALSHGALTSLICQLNMDQNNSIWPIAAWTLANFCITVDLEQAKLALSAIQRLIHSTDEEVLSHTCRGLAKICDSTYEKRLAVSEAKVYQRLEELLLHPNPSVVYQALCAVSDVISGDDIQAQCIINPQLLFGLLHVITRNHNNKCTKLACLIISNITGENQEQVEAVISAGIIGPLVLLLQTAEFVIKKEAAIAIVNALYYGSAQQIMYLVSHGCIRGLCGLLVSSDLETVLRCLEGLEIILKAGETEKIRDKNVYAQFIYETGMLEKMQSHANHEISEKAVKLLGTYCSKHDLAVEIERNRMKVSCLKLS